MQLYEKDTPAQISSCEYCEIFKNKFFCGRLLVTPASPHQRFEEYLSGNSRVQSKCRLRDKNLTKS